MFIIDGIAVNHKVSGAEGAAWVTLVTGIANDTSMWDAQLPALEPHFRVLRYDLRGQGGTQATKPPYSIAQLVQDLVGLWDKLGIGKTHLVGLGLGGGIVQAAAVQHGERLISLMPVCCRGKMVPDFAAMWHGLIAKVESEGVESIVEQTAQRWFSDEFKVKNPQVLDQVRAMIRKTSLDGYLGCVQAFLGLDVEKDLGKIRVPTHYLSGADDKLGGPPALMAGLAARVPGARHASVPNAAHIANIQNPGAFNAAVVEFLKQHS
jgi:3-oxoadipate enol-lactonase